MPDLIDAPHYILEVELHFPNLASIAARAVQPVLIAQAPNLAIGLPLMCAVDPADPLRPICRGLASAPTPFLAQA
jgi:hypothetical protein